VKYPINPKTWIRDTNSTSGGIVSQQNYNKYV